MPRPQPRRKETVRRRKVGDEWLLYDSDSGTMHVINATAEFVWQTCDGAHTEDEIAEAVREAFEMPAAADVKKDVADILRSFLDKGLIEPQDAR